MKTTNPILSIIIVLALMMIGVLSCKNDKTPAAELVTKSATEADPIPQNPNAFKLDYAISLYKLSLGKSPMKSKGQGALQLLDEDKASQVATDYLKAWDTHDKAEIKQKLNPLFATDGIYSDPGETARGIDTLTEVISGMHRNLKGLIRTFSIQGKPQLIENTQGLFHNVENVLVYNWHWMQDGKMVLPGKNMTLFHDDHKIKYDMGIFSTESFPHFKHLPKSLTGPMEQTIQESLSQLNDLTASEKYEILKTALIHPASKVNGNQDDLLASLKKEDLNEAVFKISGKPSFTRMSIAYPWTLTKGGEILMKGREINVFDKQGEVIYAFGFSGN